MVYLTSNPTTEVQATIRDLQKKLLSGDDKAARAIIGGAAMIFFSDIGYRIMTSTIEIKLPKISDILSSISLTSAVKPFGATEVFLDVLDSLLNHNWLKVESEELWPLPITLAAGGILIGGILMLIANHPEWVVTTIDAAQRALEEAKQISVDLIKAVTENIDGIEDIGALAGLAPLLTAAAGVVGATVVPGVPPPP